MAYTDRPDPVNHPNYTAIYVIRSLDNGTTWNNNNPAMINTDPSYYYKSHFWPRIAVDQTSGKVAVCWYDCRGDPANTKTRFYASGSADGGTTFSLGNIQLETGQSDIVREQGFHDWDYYDYTGLAYWGGYFYSAWADNSNTLGDNLDMILMDIYVAKVKY